MQHERQAFVYILTNKRHSVLYVGVTNDLARRLQEHSSKKVGRFTNRYNVYKLVYYEMTERIEHAIAREKQLKGGSRKKKLALIQSINQNWHDLTDEILG